MRDESKNIFETALHLPVNMRAELAATLIDSLDSGADTGVEAAWEQEVSQRIQDIDSKNVRTIPWQEVRKKILGNG